MQQTSDSSCVGAFRVSVAAKALNMLPQAISADAVTSLASCGMPRVVPRREISFLSVLILVLSGAMIGYAICHFLQKSKSG